MDLFGMERKITFFQSCVTTLVNFKNTILQICHFSITVSTDTTIDGDVEIEIAKASYWMSESTGIWFRCLILFFGKNSLQCQQMCTFLPILFIIYQPFNASSDLILFISINILKRNNW